MKGRKILRHLMSPQHFKFHTISQTNLSLHTFPKKHVFFTYGYSSKSNILLMDGMENIKHHGAARHVYLSVLGT